MVVGDFSPTLHRTRDIEVAVKHYRAGDHEPAHYHKIAREFTAVISGRVRDERPRVRSGRHSSRSSPAKPRISVA